MNPTVRLALALSLAHGYFGKIPQDQRGESYHNIKKRKPHKPKK